jgi:integrase
MKQEAHGLKIRESASEVNGKSYPRWIVDLGVVDGTRKRRSFRTEAEALEFAEAEAKRRRIIGEDSGKLSKRDLRDAVEALNILANRATLATVARFYVEHTTPPGGGMRTVRDFVQEHIQAKEKAGRRDATISDLRHRLGKLSEKIGDRHIHEVTSYDLEAVLDEGGYKGATRNTFLRHFRALWTAAIRAKVATSNPATDLDKHSVDEGEIDFFSPDEVEAVMRLVASYDLENGTAALPYFAVGLFAGCRPLEITRLDWSDVSIETRRIRITGKVAKTRRGRNVEMPDNLIAWLSQYRRADGRLAPSDRTLRAVVARAKKAVRWGHDIMRHTCGTYHFAQHENIGKTARMLGNDIKTSERHYCNGMATREQAASFWAIRPESTSAVIQFPKVSAG